MIITRTPFRISFVGGGSDLPAFYKNHQGAVLSTSINKYMYISSHQFFEQDKIRLKYSKTETVSSFRTYSILFSERLFDNLISKEGLNFHLLQMFPQVQAWVLPLLLLLVFYKISIPPRAGMFLKRR